MYPPALACSFCSREGTGLRLFRILWRLKATLEPALTRSENVLMRSNFTRALLALLAGLVAGTTLPEAARCQPTAVEREELARRADVIVVGKVTAINSEWNSNRTRIQSRVTLSVDQHIKGEESGTSVTILTLGGEVDGVGEVYSHTARFKEDERVVVFAGKDRQGVLRVIGGDDGKLTVTKEEGTGRQFVADNESLEVFTARLRSLVEAERNK